MKKDKTDPALDETLDDKAEPALDEALDDDEFDDDVNEMVAAVSREMDADEAPSALSDGDHRIAWERRLGALHRKVARPLRKFMLVPLAMLSLDEIEKELFGWKGHERPDPTVVATAWREAMSKPRRDATMKVVCRVIRETKRLAHVEQLGSHECASSLPDWQRDPQVCGGVLEVKDVSPGTPTFGRRGYLEATPVEVPVLVVRYWMSRTGKTRPRCWDVTAGSGTVGEVIGTVFGGVVVETDIANQGRVSFGDLREVGGHSLQAVRPRQPFGVRRPIKAVVTEPDLVFIHPPAIGGPACCSFLEGEHQRAAALDLGLLGALEGRARYIAVVAAAITAAVGRLAPGGLISLLLPEYVRRQQEVSSEPGMADALLEALEGRCRVVERHLVRDVAPLAQASLGWSRGPVVHLILEASSEKAPSR